MTAQDLVRFVLLGPLGLPANTKATDVVLAAVRDENVVEVAKANGTVELVLVALLFCLGIVDINWIIIYAFNVCYLHVSTDAHLIAFLHCLVVFNSNLREYSFLLLKICLIGTFDKC